MMAMPRYIKNFRMGLVLTSRVSKETSSCCGLPGSPWMFFWGSVLMMCNGLRKFRISQGEQRLLLKIEGEKTNPQSDQGDGNHDVQPGGQRAGSKFRPRHPVQIHQAHENHPDGDLGDQARAAFDVARQEHEKRQREAEKQDNYRDHAPAAIQTRAVKGNLFGLVAGPDDQQLRKIEIGPKHVESEEQLSQIVEVTLLDDSRVGL